MSIWKQNNNQETPREAITGGSNGSEVFLDTRFDESKIELQRSEHSLQNFNNIFV